MQLDKAKRTQAGVENQSFFRLWSVFARRTTFGEPRATEDTDVVADLHADEIGRLVAALADECYVDEVAPTRSSTTSSPPARPAGWPVVGE